MNILDRINEPNDIKKISDDDLRALAKEIRLFLIKNVSKTGGHLASNLGAVELTIALHRFLTFPKDKLIFDVGHQCYTHKILTGRKNDFSSLRQYGGLCGFPKISESNCDAYQDCSACRKAFWNAEINEYNDEIKETREEYKIKGD